MIENNDDKLINEFFADNVKDLSDGGFTKRVMRSLPDSKVWWADKVWTLICTVAVVVLFISKDGFKVLGSSFGLIFKQITTGLQLAHPNYSLIAVICLAVIYCGVSLWKAFLDSEEL